MKLVEQYDIAMAVASAVRTCISMTIFMQPWFN
jgi:hypothetical protein